MTCCPPAGPTAASYKRHRRANTVPCPQPPMTVADRQGYEAGRLGVELSKNPYRDTSLLGYQQWRAGWLRAEKDADDANVHVQFREPK